MFLGLQNGPLNVGFQGRANPLEHQVKGGKLPDLVVTDLNGHLLEYAEHGALADRAVFSLKCVMLRQVLNRGLKHRKLVRDKRITVDEVVPVQKVAVGLGAVGKVKKGLKIVRFVMMDF